MSHGGARKGAGRPRTADPRSEVVFVRVTVAEKAALVAAACDVGAPVAAWVRSAALAAASAEVASQ